MAPVIRTHADVARWIAIQTAYAASLRPAGDRGGVALAVLAETCRTCSTGGRRRGSFSALTLAETMLFTPLVALRSVETLRQLNLARDELDRLAAIDPLTGLLNRRGFEGGGDVGGRARGARRARHSARLRLRRVEADPTIVFGHDFGDAGLRRLARRPARRRGRPRLCARPARRRRVRRPDGLAPRAARRSLSPKSFAPP